MRRSGASRTPAPRRSSRSRCMTGRRARAPPRRRTGSRSRPPTHRCSPTTITFAGREVPVPPASAALAAARALGAGHPDRPDGRRGPLAYRRRHRPDRRPDERGSSTEAAAEGCAVGYHNHSFEFHHRIGDLTAYEYFVSLLDAARRPRARRLLGGGRGAGCAGARRAARLPGPRAAPQGCRPGRSTSSPPVVTTTRRCSTQCALGRGVWRTTRRSPPRLQPVFRSIEFDHVEDAFTAIAASIAHLQAIRTPAGPLPTDAAGATS